MKPNININKYMCTIYFVVLIGSLVILCKASPDPKSHINEKRFSLHPPKIWLGEYTDTDSMEFKSGDEFKDLDVYQDDYISLNNSELVVTSNVGGFSIMCQANYPVKWTLPQTEKLSDSIDQTATVSFERVSTFNDDQVEPQNTGYLATMNFVQHFSFCKSGYIQCQSVSNPHLSSKLYIYRECVGNLPTTRSQKVVRVNVTASTTKVILPCKPELPDMSITLHKLFKNQIQPKQSRWIRIDQNPQVSFDPKVGFILNAHVFGFPNIFGLYNCTAQEEETPFLVLNVTQGSIIPVDFKPQNIISSEKAKFTAIMNPIACCTGVINSPPKIVSINCNNEAECELWKPVFLKNIQNAQNDIEMSTTHQIHYDMLGIQAGCARRYFTSYHTHQSMLFWCNGDGISVMGHYLQTYTPATKKLYSDHSREMKLVTSRIIDISSGIGNVKEETIYFSMNRFRGTLYHNKRLRKFGIAPHIPTNVNYEYGYDRSFISRRRPAGYFRPVFGKLYEGEYIQIICTNLQYYYAAGGWIQLNWKNGSRTIFLQDDAKSQYGTSMSHYGYEYGLPDTNFRYSRNTFIGNSMDHTVVRYLNKVSLEMESVDCFAPVWNNDQWEKKTFKFKVQESNLPQLLYPEEETLIVKLNQDHVAINCSLAATIVNIYVPTKITWYKDGQVLFASDIGMVVQSFVKNITVSSFQFSNVSHSIHGEYQCVAENLKGEVRKTFRVYIDTENSNTLVIAVLAISGVIGLLICAIRLLVWKHQALLQEWRTTSRANTRARN